MSPTSIRQYDTRNLFTFSSLSNIKTSCLILFAVAVLFNRFCHERFQLAVEHGSCGRNPAVAGLLTTVAAGLIALFSVLTGSEPASALSKEQAIENCRQTVGAPIVRACMQGMGKGGDREANLATCRAGVFPKVKACVVAALNAANGRANVAIEIYKNGKPKPGKPGGTRHDYALAEAFSLKPETIYMLTDGNATESQTGGGLKPIPPQEIYRVAEEGQKQLPKKAHLHVIYYMNGQEKSDEVDMLRGLASRNSGKFQKVEAKGRKK
jgi:hypothetical protein